MQTVYYASARVRTWDYDYSVPAKFEEMIRRMNFRKYIKKDEYVAIKTHLGSVGSFRIIRPIFLRKLVDAVRAVGAWPFVCDTFRRPGLQYLDLAAQEGFTHGTVGAPVVMADGLFGYDGVTVRTGPLLGEITIASAVYDARAMIVVSHCKGHIEAGYAGAIKNLAMGCVSARARTGGRASRGRLHAHGGAKLVWSSDLCNLCGQCVRVCPTGALSLKDRKWCKNEDLCWGCNRCSRVCPTGALKDTMEVHEFQLGLAEAARAVIRTFEPGKIIYTNFVLEVTPECDCMPTQDTPLIQDQGILMSDDVVAIEQASYDLIGKAKPLPQSLAEDMRVKPGDHVLERVNPGKDPEGAIRRMARYRMGSRKYRLITVQRKAE